MKTTFRGFARGLSVLFRLRALSRWGLPLWLLSAVPSARSQTWTAEVIDPGESGSGPWPALFNNHGHVLFARSSGEWKLWQGGAEISYGFVSTPFRSLNDQNDALNLGHEIRSVSGTVTTGLGGLFQGADGPYNSPFATTWFRQGADLNLARQRVFAARFTSGGEVSVEPVIIDPPLTMGRLGHPPLAGYARLESYPAAINAAGEVAGTTLGFLAGASEPSVTRAFLYTGGQMVLLPPLGGHESQNWGATDLNDEGQVVGWNGLSGQGYFGVLWANGQATEITTPAVVYSQAYGGKRINNAGQILLSTISDAPSRVFYQAGQWHLLTDLLPPGHGYVELLAYDLNHNGQILAYGRKSWSGSAPYELLLLNPAPSSDFELDPEELNFTAAGSSPLAVRNLGYGPLPFTVAVEIPGGGSWLTVSPLADQVSPQDQLDLTVTVNTAGISPGTTRTGTIRVTAAGVERTAEVTLALPALDEVTWGPAPFLVPPGSPVSVSSTQPRLFLPVSYRLGSESVALLSVEAWDQTGRYLGGSDEQLVVASPSFRSAFFVIRGFGSGVDLSGVTGLTLRALLIDPDLPAPLASSPSIEYPLAAAMTVEWGGTYDDETFQPYSWTHVVAGNDYAESIKPAARVTLPGGGGQVNLLSALRARTRGGASKLVGAIQGRSGQPLGPVVVPLGPLLLDQLDGLEELQFEIHLVGESGRVLNEARLVVPAVALHIVKAVPNGFKASGSGVALDVTLEYKTYGPGSWDVVLLGPGGEVKRVLEDDLPSSGTLTAAGLSYETDLFTKYHSFGPQVYAWFGLRKNGTRVSSTIMSLPTPFGRYRVPLAPPAAPPPVEDLGVTFRDVGAAQALDLITNLEFVRDLVREEEPASGVVPRKWSFDPPQPPGQFSAEIELGYFLEDLPDFPGFSENSLQILAYDPVAGTYLPLATTLDPVNKTATARIDGLAPSYALGMASPPAERFLDFPMLDAAGVPASELLVSQVGPDPARASLFPYLDSGLSAESPGTSLVPPRVPSLGQISFPWDESLPPPVREFSGWLRLHAPASSGAVLALRSSGRADFLAPSVPAPDLTLPLARAGAGGFATYLHLLNSHNHADSVEIVAVAPDGTIVTSGRWTLPARGRLGGELDQLLPDLPSGWVGTLRIQSARGMSGAAVESGGRAIAVTPLRPVRPEGIGPRHWYAPWFSHGGGSHRAELAVTNTGTTGLTVQARALADDGGILGAPADLALAPNQQWFGEIGSLLNLPAGLHVASLQLNASHGGLAAQLLVGDAAASPEFLSSVPLSSVASGDLLLPALDESPGRATELSLANPSAGSVDATVTVHRPDGVALESVVVPLPAGGRTTRSMSVLRPAAAGMSHGFIRVQCATPLHAAALVAETSGNSLASVAPMPFRLDLPPPLTGAAPQFLGITPTADGRVQFHATGSPGTTLRLEYSSDLRNWRPIRFGIHPAEAGAIDFELPVEEEAAAFYRFRPE